MAKVRTRQRKSGTWSYVFEGAKVDGKRKPIEKGGFQTEADAYAAGVKAFQEYSEAGTVFRATDSSVADYMDWWLKHAATKDVRPNTIQNYAKMIKCHIKPDLGGYPLKALSPVVIDEWVIKKWKQYHYAYGTIDGMLKTLKVALDYAVYPGQFIRDNPARFIRVPNDAKSQSRERPIMSLDDMDKIWKRFPFGSNYHMPIFIGFHTSFRIGEVLGLTWNDVDFEKRTITLTQQIQRIPGRGTHGQAGKGTGTYHICPVKTKSSERTIMIGDTLMNELIRWKAKQEENKKLYGGDYQVVHVFREIDPITEKKINRIKTYSVSDKITAPKVDFICTQECGDFIRANSFSYAARIARVELGVDNFDFHSLRHTHATMLLEAGAQLKDVSRRLGHKSIETTADIYIRDTKQMQNDTVDIFEKLIQRK